MGKIFGKMAQAVRRGMGMGESSRTVDLGNHAFFSGCGNGGWGWSYFDLKKSGFHWKSIKGSCVFS